jgi:hypothetical protein
MSDGDFARVFNHIYDLFSGGHITRGEMARAMTHLSYRIHP